MRWRRKLTIISVTVFIALLLGLKWGTSALAMDCTKAAFDAIGLTDEKFSLPVTIDSAEIVPGTATVPEYCDVVGTMWPTIRFEVALPTTTWNQRLLMAGNGGKAGTISKGTSTSSLLPSGGIIPAVKLGYAATSTDTGHCSAYIASNPGGCPAGTTLYPGSRFAYLDYPAPDANPDWYQKLEDFAYRAVHETIVVAKKMVTNYYDEALLFTYWVGCSTGGRQGLMEAQRYPADFDGISAGSAVNAYMAQQMSGPEQLGPQYSPGCDTNNEFCGGPQIPPANLAYLGEAVYNKCDGIDGLVDGIIDDPLNCDFDVEADLNKCPQETYVPYTDQPDNCFTTTQRGALEQIYAGGFTSGGELVVARTLPGAEAMSGGWSPWLVSAHLNSTLKYIVVADAFNYLIFETPQPLYNFFTDWDWDTDPPLTAERGELLDATNPDLSDFFHHGGKIIMYHGWADVSANPLANTFPYYEEVLDLLPQAKASLAYYLVPGMGHCGGGVGCGNIDWLTPLVNWVENGKQPHTLVGLSTNPAYPTRTRPICRYPQVEKYKGHGDINDAKNFVCVAPEAVGKKIASEDSP